MQHSILAATSVPRLLIAHEAGLFDFLTEPFSQTALALLHGGNAHGSYWHSEKVAEEISSVLKPRVSH